MSFSLSFDGSTGYVSEANLDGGANFSVLLWVKRGRLAANDFLWASKQDHGWALFFGSGGGTDNKIGFGKNGDTWGANSNGTIADTTGWHLIVVTHSSTQIGFYIDGAFDSTTNLSLSFNSSGGAYDFGARNGTSYFLGKIGLACVVPSVLNGTQVGQLWTGALDPATLSPTGLWKFTEGTGTTTADSSGNSNTGTFNGGVAWSTDIPPIFIPFTWFPLANLDSQRNRYVNPDAGVPNLSPVFFTGVPRGKPVDYPLIPRYQPFAVEQTRQTRLQRITDQTSEILNSLMRKGQLVFEAAQEWGLNVGVDLEVTNGITSAVNGITVTLGLGDITPSSVTVPVLNLPPTTSTTVGIINQGGDTFLHSLGTGNLFLGYQSGKTLTTGIDNVAFGYQTLAAVTTGSYNNAFGPYCLRSVTTGVDNIAIGFICLEYTTSGCYNIAMGDETLRYANGNANIGIGEWVMHTDVMTGSSNIAIGYFSLIVLSSGSYNTAVGNYAGYIATTGCYNALYGASVGSALTTGSNNVLLGPFANVASGDQSYSLAIGRDAVSPGSNIGVLGSTGPTKYLNVGVCAGQSTSYCYLGGVLFDHYADAGNTTTSNTTLYTDTIPDATLSGAGSAITATYAGITVASATATRQIQVYFAGTLIFDSTAQLTTSAANWEVRVTIVQDSTTSVRCSVSMADNLNLSGWTGAQYTAVTGLTLSGGSGYALYITGTSAGTGAASNDIVAKFGKVKWDPA